MVSVAVWINIYINRDMQRKADLYVQLKFTLLCIIPKNASELPMGLQELSNSSERFIQTSRKAQNWLNVLTHVTKKFLLNRKC